MQFVFRKLHASDVPAAGELLISVPRDAADRDALALAALDRGVAAFPQGAAPISTLVLAASPTLDDLLAAQIVEERLAEHPLPGGLQPFARYANLRRTGLTPSSVPLEVSLEGIYLAILNAGDGDLTKPATAAQFVAAWRRMAKVVWDAAAASSDPFTTELFSHGGDFAKERAFLKQDRAVFQQDVLGGQQWVVDVPGAPRGGRALLLHEPKSLLFAPWSREKDASGAGQPFLLLAVDWGQGQWVFSTDPAQRLAIGGLADELQRAEVAADAQSAAGEPWVKRFDDSMVANRQTKLPDDKVVALVKRWAHARRPPKPARAAWIVAAVAVAAMLAFVIFDIVTRPPYPLANYDRHRGDEQWTPPPKDVALTDEDKELQKNPDTNYALLFGTDHYKIDKFGEQWDALDNPIDDVTSIRDILDKTYGFDAKIYKDQTLDQINTTIADFLRNTKFGLHSELLVFFAGHGYFDAGLNKGFVVASDSLHAHKDSDRYKTCLSLDELADTLGKSRCRHVFLMLDTCFGGTVLPKYALGKTRGEIDRSVVDGILDNAKSRIVLASVGKVEALDGDKGGHSPFALRVIEALQNKKGENQGVVTARMIFNDAAWNRKQAPVFGGLPGQEDGGEFLFVPK